MINITQEQIMQNWSDTETPLVSVICCTYNHEPFIAQTLEGFLIQKTNFPFEVLVNDDASTDGTAKIIKEYEEKYPSIIKPFYHDVNEYSQGIDIFGNLVKLAKGKYIAICEGDDYWIDENKLQMQVDFLEKNPDYGLCYTKTKQFIQSENKFARRTFGSKERSFEELLIIGNNIPTLTTVFRKTLIINYYAEIKPFEQHWLMGDYPMWLFISHESNIKFFDIESSIYRILVQSASHSLDDNKQLDFKKSSFAVRQFFANRYNVNGLRFDENKELFDIYHNRLLRKYSKKYLKKLYFAYNNIEKKTKREKIILFFAKSKFLFSFYKFCLVLKK